LKYKNTDLLPARHLRVFYLVKKPVNIIDPVLAPVACIFICRAYFFGAAGKIYHQEAHQNKDYGNKNPAPEYQNEGTGRCE
jgi:hypothetical protein